MVPQGIATAGGEGFFSRYDRTAARMLGPGAPTRLLALARGSSLDRALIAGDDPGGSKLLAARATILTSRRTRSCLAGGLERVLEASEGPQRRWWALSPSSPALANTGEIRALAELLRGDRPLYARGLAILNRLLTDGSGPLFRGQPVLLGRLLREAGAYMIDWSPTLAR